MFIKGLEGISIIVVNDFIHFIPFLENERGMQFPQVQQNHKQVRELLFDDLLVMFQLQKNTWICQSIMVWELPII